MSTTLIAPEDLQRSLASSAGYDRGLATWALEVVSNTAMLVANRFDWTPENVPPAVQSVISMAAATAVFMACCLPFLDRTITLSWQSFAAIGLLCLSKILEFKLSAIILDEISAFELKAWLGITLFMSYATDIFLGEKPSIFKFLFIVLTVAGLVFIAKSGRTDSGNINYRRIVVPLVFYLLARYGYGIVVRASENYISSTMALFFALILMAIILLPRAKPLEIFKKNQKGAWVVVLTKIPNVAGLLAENAVIAVSLASASFIQPMILCSLFVIALIRKEPITKLRFIGSVICMVGIIGFQVC
jgi:drug/metabolite transporter (DMT)-like permease